MLDRDNITSKLHPMACVTTSQALLVSGFRSPQGSLTTPLLGSYQMFCTSIVHEGPTAGNLFLDPAPPGRPTQTVSRPTSPAVTIERRKKRSQIQVDSHRLHRYLFKRGRGWDGPTQNCCAPFLQCPSTPHLALGPPESCASSQPGLVKT